MALHDVPQPGETLAHSQNLIRQNFITIGNDFAIDHVGYGITGEGKHNKITFPVQTVAPTFSAGEEGLYNLISAGVSELFVHKQSHAGTKEIPFTKSVLSSATPGMGVGGWTYLPSGVYMTWGDGSGTGVVTVTLTSPPPTQLSTVLITPFNTSVSYVNLQTRLIGIDSRTKFRVFVSVNGAAAAGSFTFLAIGY